MPVMAALIVPLASIPMRVRTNASSVIQENSSMSLERRAFNLAKRAFPGNTPSKTAADADLVGPAQLAPSLAHQRPLTAMLALPESTPTRRWMHATIAQQELPPVTVRTLKAAATPVGPESSQLQVESSALPARLAHSPTAQMSTTQHALNAPSELNSQKRVPVNVSTVQWEVTLIRPEICNAYHVREVRFNRMREQLSAQSVLVALFPR